MDTIVVILAKRIICIMGDIQIIVLYIILCDMSEIGIVECNIYRNESRSYGPLFRVLVPICFGKKYSKRYA